MNVELKNCSIKQEAWEWCKEFLAGPWREISLDDFRLFEVSGGLSNTLYRCVLPENKTVDATKKEVLLRIYGPIQDDPNVVITEVVTFMVLSERNLGPKLYGVFPKGRLEEFIPSHSLSSDEIRKYSSFIAREMAKIHALEIPVRKVQDVWLLEHMNKWLIECKDAINKDGGNFFMTFDEYKKELEWILTEMKRTRSPLVYCHNDLQGGNILYREDSTKNGKPSLMLIDFEFGSYNYRGFDIANHLCEWTFDYNTPNFPHFEHNWEKFPSKEEQVDFCTSYLEQIVKEGVSLKKTLKDEVEAMIKEINIFASAAHLIWSLWSVKMTLIPTEGFGHADSDQKLFHENHDNEMGVIPVEDRHWKERMGATIKEAIKEHSKTRKELYQKFKKLHLESNSER